MNKIYGTLFCLIRKDRSENGVNMVIHIVNWNLNETVAKEDYPFVKDKMKGILEGLVGVVPGLISAKLIVNPLESSNIEVALICELESVEALKGYQVHPAHVEAGNYVKSVVCDRHCLDYEA